MDEQDTDKLRRNRTFLVREVIYNEISDHLYQYDILDFDNKEALENLPNNTEKMRRVLDILPKRGPKAFPIFLDVLKEINREDIVQRLQDTPYTRESVAVQEGQGSMDQGYDQTDLTDWFDRIIKSGKDKPLNEQVCALLARDIGDINVLGSLLGFKQSHISQIKYDNPYNTANQALTLLVKWLQKEYPTASSAKLVPKLREAQIPDENFKDVIEKFCNNKPL